MSHETRVLRIGIASREMMKARTIAIARGEHKPGPNEPKVWFASMESLAQVLSTKNQLLLELIRRLHPASMKELADISGRKPGNLSRTLRNMERYRLVKLNKSEEGTIVPEVPYESLTFDLPVAAMAAGLVSQRRPAV